VHNWGKSLGLMFPQIGRFVEQKAEIQISFKA